MRSSAPCALLLLALVGGTVAEGSGCPNNSSFLLDIVCDAFGRPGFQAQICPGEDGTATGWRVYSVVPCPHKLKQIVMTGNSCEAHATSKDCLQHFELVRKIQYVWSGLELLGQAL